MNIFKKRILAIDITHLPEEYLEMSLEDLRLKLKSDLGISVLLLDSSRVNTNSTRNNHKCYFIK